ncbi:MAG: carboxypeptidase-like regulatory domain-containing protein [Cyanobacteriota bacterium]
MKKIIYLTVCSVVLFSCSTTLNQPNNDITKNKKEIKSIIVKSRKDGYVIAKTGESKSQFNFDNRIESQDSFSAEVEYQDGSKNEQVIWESNNSNVISVDNGIIKGISYGFVDINIYNPDNKSQKVDFRANFVDNLFNSKIECSNDIGNLSKYSYYYDSNVVDVKEKATFNGKVFDSFGTPVDDAIMTAKSINPCVVWQAESQQTQSGAYVFRNAPVGVKIEITVKKDGFTTKTRREVLKSNLIGDPRANVFDFGSGNGANGTDPNNLYAIQVL